MNRTVDCRGYLRSVIQPSSKQNNCVSVYNVKRDRIIIRGPIVRCEMINAPSEFELWLPRDFQQPDLPNYLTSERHKIDGNENDNDYIDEWNDTWGVNDNWQGKKRHVALPYAEYMINFVGDPSPKYDETQPTKLVVYYSGG